MAGDRTSFMSTDSGYFESEDYWDEEEETVPSAHQQDRPKEEPMSPVAVVRESSLSMHNDYLTHAKFTSSSFTSCGKS